MITTLKILIGTAGDPLGPGALDPSADTPPPSTETRWCTTGEGPLLSASTDIGKDGRRHHIQKTGCGEKRATWPNRQHAAP